MKVNKSQIARELGVDTCTVDKYINGYTKPSTRLSNIVEFYPIIKELLSDESKYFIINVCFGNIQKISL
ncbi:hypothetical protein SH1V18_27250 [Vallitalea longa]|uniref:Uncharacterized protein n=1 Tax=Vallitalea longa TaxID=2936439 RepID=A0A9W5YCU8_9FIRM|nr:hypothetical protein SH1V18_27250 [Vallitalea longa]